MNKNKETAPTSINTPSKKTTWFDSLSYALIFALGFLMPFSFFPFFGVSVEVGKSMLLSVVVVVSFLLWLVARLKDGRFVFPKSVLLLSGAAVVVATFFSSVFSDVPKKSFVGLGYEIGTFSSILLLCVVMFLSSIYFQRKERIQRLYLSIFISSAIVFVYQLVRFVFLSFGLPLVDFFLRLPANIVGKWADLSILFGLVIVLSLITLEFGTVGSLSRKLIHLTIGASLIVLTLVNFKMVWLVAGIFSLVIFVYSISFGKSSFVGGKIGAKERKIPAMPFFVLIVSLFFVLSGNLVNDSIYSLLKIPQEVLRPSLGDTVDAARDSLKENPIFGIGPNRFANQWLLSKDASINTSILWNTDFNFGVGMIPTFMVTSGIAGILAWLLFVGAFLYRGVFSVFLLRINAAHSYTVVSSFFAAFYLWVFTFFYVPNIAIVSLAFLMTGVFLAALAESRIVKNYNFSFLDDPRVGFASVLVLILLIVGTIAGGYVLLQKFISIGYYQRAIISLNVYGNIDDAREYATRAIKLSGEDVYYRLLAEVDLRKISNVLSQDNISKDTLKTQFQALSQSAIKNAISATEVDKTNYKNWLMLAQVYQSLIPFGAPDEFYQSAKDAYLKASRLNPNNPAISLSLARLEIAMGNKDVARDYIAQALNQKSNYSEAIFLLSQMQADEGKIKDAIASAEVATLISPNDIGAFFQLGLLKYKIKDYEGAAAAFGRAVELRPNYSNAKYFLGLSLYNIGNKDAAIRQFEDVLALNPGNQEVEEILDNLRAGRNPFADSVRTRPEDRKELPIDE